MRAFVATAAVVLAMTGTAGAQIEGPWRDDRPYRGLFGAGFGETAQRLTANFNVGAGFDNNVLLGTGVRDSNFRQPKRGGYGIGSAGLIYSWQRGTFQLSASGNGTTRYYASTNSDLVSSAGARVSAAFRIKTVRVNLSEALSYRPYNIMGLSGLPTVNDTPELVSPLDEEELVISPVRFRNHSTTASVNQNFTLGRRGSISLGYNAQRSDVSRGPSPFWGHGANFRYSHRILRDVSAYVGYRYSEYWYPDAEGVSQSVTHHVPDFGLNFNRAFTQSLRRGRVTFSVVTGSAITSRRYRERMRTHYMATGGAQLTREFGRTWATTLMYRRGVAFVETFGDPFLYDGVGAQVGGLFSRRTRFVAGGEAIRGQIGLNSDQPYDAYRGGAVLTVALTRFLAAGTSYTYSRFRFQGSPLLPTGSLTFADRHGVRAYLTAFVPLYTRTRRPDAAR